MSNENITNKGRTWTDEEVYILKRIVRHTLIDGGNMKEALEKGAYRLERTYTAVSQYWYTHIGTEYTNRIMLKHLSGDEEDDNRGQLLPFEPEPEHVKDTRYNLPRLPPKANDADVEEVIASNPIYKSVRQGMFDAQHRQVAYGLDKYPEPLNASTWTIIETIDHIISETVDKLHYLTMLKIKLQQELEE